MNLPIKIKRVGDPEAVFNPPAYMSDGASGMDLSACLTAALTLQPMERGLVPCGFSIELPPGFEAQIRPRSGLAIRQGITCLNSPGTIDHDYRGEVKVVLINLGAEPFEIKPGERIAQLVIQRVERAQIQTAEDLNHSARGAGGFGSTGR